MGSWNLGRAAEGSGLLPFMKTSPAAVGSNFNRLLADFIAKGGDLDRCPFDTDNYKYEGPVLKDGEICGE